MDQSVATITQDYVPLQITEPVSAGLVDDGAGRVPVRDAAHVFGALVRALRAVLAAGRAERGGLAAVGADPAFFPLGVAGAIGVAFRRPVPGLGDGARPAKPLPVECRRRAPGAQPRGPAPGIRRSLGLAPRIQARLAARSAGDRRATAASDAARSPAAIGLALAAPSPSLPSPGADVPAAIEATL